MKYNSYDELKQTYQEYEKSYLIACETTYLLENNFVTSFRDKEQLSKENETAIQQCKTFEMQIESLKLPEYSTMIVIYTIIKRILFGIFVFCFIIIMSMMINNIKSSNFRKNVDLKRVNNLNN